ncbi:MAG: VWA domain-containing protein [Motiliproteus sp.]|nr:VWA domain-containing protein [Motiliproteus sp.]
MTLRNCWYSFLIVLANLFTVPAQAAEQSILVLDASGSMWGQINGKAKIGIARQVIGNVLETWPEDHQLGLITYGHRRKGDCSDIEELIPPGQLNAKAFKQRIKRINPKGKTPLTAAVKQAAERLRYTEDKATVILVSDGKETCKADPCAVSAELEKSGVDFTTHVIGFDVSDKQGIKQLQCLAENTGGQYFSAKDASGLKEALGEAVKQIAKDSKNLRMRTVFTPGGEPVGGSWFTLYREQTSSSGQTKREKVKTSGYYTNVAWQVAPGEYIAAATYGNASVEVPVVIEADKALDLELNLNAANLNLFTVLSTGNEKVGGSWFTIYQLQTDSSGHQKRVKITGKGYYPETDFILPAGDYIASATYGNAIAEIPVTVIAGEYQGQEIDLKAGILETFTVLSSGAEKVGGSWFTIYQDSTTSAGQPQRKKITGKGYYPETSFILNEGSYALHAVYGNAAKEIPVEVKANQTVRQEIDLNAGILELFTVMDSGKEKVGGTWFTVYRDEVKSSGQVNTVKVTGKGYYPETSFILPVGDYKVHAAYGNAELNQPVSVSANKTQREELNLAAGRLKVFGQLSPTSEKLPGNWFTVYREDQDSSGQSKRVKVASKGYYPEAEFILSAGDYIVHAANGNASAEIPVTVAVDQFNEQPVDLNAGRLTLRTVDAAGGAQVGGSWFTVYKEVSAGDGSLKEEKVAGKGYNGEVTLTIGAGEYVVRATNQQRKGAHKVVVEAGKATFQELLLQ